MMSKFQVLAVIAVLSTFLATSVAQTDSEEPSREDLLCIAKSSLDDCKACIGGTNGSVSLSCYWCPGAANTSLRCRHFGFNTAIPINGIECPQLKYHVGTCVLNALSIIIIIAVACLLIVVLTCCACCCCCICCAKRRQRIKMVEEERYYDEKEGIRQRSAERRAERKAKHDEIRRKYGLYHDDQGEGTYKRLD